MNGGTILLRVDGGRETGLGHLMRCLLLSDALERRGLAPILLMRERCELQHLLSRFARTAVALPPAAGEIECAQQADHIKQSLGADALVIDLPEQLGAEQYEAYSRLGLPIAVLDQHGLAAGAADLVINAIAHPDDAGAETGRENYYCGPDYMILDPAYTAAKPVEVRQEANRVLVAMGGADPHDITSKTLRALSSLPERVQLDVLLGPANPLARDNAGGLPHKRARVHRDVEDLPTLLATFDLAIISFGITAYGAASLGLPTIILAHNDDGATAANAFAGQHGCARFLGRHDLVAEDDVAEATAALLADAEERQRMSRRGRGAVDGRGLERAAELLAALARR